MTPLIIASSSEMREKLSEMSAEAKLPDAVLSDGKDARELVRSGKFELIMLLLPLEDEFGLELADELNKLSSAEIILYVPSKSYDEVCQRISDRGFFILPKNISRNIAVSTIRTAASVNSRYSLLKSDNDMLRRMLAEIKLVNRAKCVLIEYLKISEKDAHRQIQKRAMDQRITLTEAAADILKTYEYL